MSKILSNEWATAVAEQYGLDPRDVYRVIVDAQVGEPMRVYFSTYGTDAMFDVAPPVATAPFVRVYKSGPDGPVEITGAAA